MANVSPFEIAKRDLENLNPLQEFLGSGDVPSILLREEESEDCVAFSRAINARLNTLSVQNSPGEFSFTPGLNGHALNSLRLRQVIPEAFVKAEYMDDYEISWCHNLGHNIIKEATTKRKDKNISAPITSITLDLYLQFYVHPSERASYRKSIGTRPQLTNWSTKLAKSVVNVFLPFGFTSSISKSLRLLVLNDIKPTFDVILRNKVNELLRLRQCLPDGTYRMCNNEEILEKVSFRGVNTDNHLQAPEMWGRYINLQESECNYWLNLTRTAEYRTYVNEMNLFPISTKSPDGTSVLHQFTLKGEFSARAMFWVAINPLCSTYNNYSNYSTDVHDMSEGDDPVINSSFVRNNDSEWHNLPSDHNNDGLDPHLGVYKPDEPGYHAVVWCNNLSNNGIDNTVDFGMLESQLSVTTSTNNCSVHVYMDTLRCHQYQLGELTVLTNKLANARPPTIRPAIAPQIAYPPQRG